MQSIRMATDCSGMGIPEIARKTLATQKPLEIEQLFAADIASPYQKWLKSLAMGGLISAT